MNADHRRAAIEAAGLTLTDLAMRCATTVRRLRRVIDGDARDYRIEKHVAARCNVPVETMFTPLLLNLPASVESRWDIGANDD